MNEKNLLEQLEAAGPNAVVYSEDAWAVARKSSGGEGHGAWFADHGATKATDLTSKDLADWARDWVFLRGFEVVSS